MTIPPLPSIPYSELLHTVTIGYERNSYITGTQ